MGAFNTVRGQTVCPECSINVEVAAEFKFGSVWQHEYRIGDCLQWGRNDIGRRGVNHAVVDAVAESACPKCGFSKEWNLYLHIEHAQLIRLETAHGEYDFAQNPKNFIIVKP